MTQFTEEWASQQIARARGTTSPKHQPGSCTGTSGHITEAETTRQIRSVLKQARVFHWKQWQGPMSQPKGVADILGIYQGRFMAIEIKRPGGVVKPWQQDFLDRVNKEGGIAFVAYSVEDVVEKLGLGFKLHPMFTS